MGEERTNSFTFVKCKRGIKRATRLKYSSYASLSSSGLGSASSPVCCVRLPLSSFVCVCGGASWTSSIAVSRGSGSNRSECSEVRRMRVDGCEGTYEAVTITVSSSCTGTGSGGGGGDGGGASASTTMGFGVCLKPQARSTVMRALAPQVFDHARILSRHCVAANSTRLSLIRGCPAQWPAIFSTQR